MRLCSWCLTPDSEAAPVKPYSIGPDKGTQRDPYRHQVDLCCYCINTLENGDFLAFYERFTSTRRIARKDQP